MHTAIIRTTLAITFTVLTLILTGCAKQPVAFTPQELAKQHNGAVLFEHWQQYTGTNRDLGVAMMDGWEDRTAYANAVRKQWFDGQHEMLPLQPVDHETRAAMAERLALIGRNQLANGFTTQQAIWAWGSPGKFEQRQSSSGLESWMYWHFSGYTWRRHAYFRNDRLLYWSDEP